MTTATIPTTHRHPTALIAGLAMLAVALVAAVVVFVANDGGSTGASRPATVDRAGQVTSRSDVSRSPGGIFHNTEAAESVPGTVSGFDESGTYSSDLGRSLGSTGANTELFYGSADAADRSSAR